VKSFEAFASESKPGRKKHPVLKTIDHLASVNTVSVWFRMFEFEACVVLKIKEFTFVNDCFQNKRNEEIGHYGQTLFSGILLLL
jgi:hypothetical protein